MPTPISKGEIILYKTLDGTTALDVHLEDETVWLSLDQISQLFSRDKSVISRHIKNIFSDRELERDSVVANFATTASDGKIYQVDYYNLDLILSVGYRVSSKQATQFRIWATQTLKEYLVKGFVVNQRRLAQTGLTEFEETLTLFRQTLQKKELTSVESKGLLDVITTYANTWLLLQRYDEGTLNQGITATKSEHFFNFEFARNEIQRLKQNLIQNNTSTNIFGNERGEMLQGIIANLYQTYGGIELYPTIEEKASHLLYFVIKDHPFSDGNKRIGSFLFILFLVKNEYLYMPSGERKFNDNALVALALLIAESKPSQKETMILLIKHLVQG
ncbi:hypothetical protein HGA88_03530 [Candidatus Roizmanbacteria bacterium]|nr:hypothetical protein [Candidatus Roizmanbacteria bacterium]